MLERLQRKSRGEVTMGGFQGGLREGREGVYDVLFPENGKQEVERFTTRGCCVCLVQSR